MKRFTSKIAEFPHAARCPPNAQLWSKNCADVYKVWCVCQSLFLCLEHNSEALLRVALEIVTCKKARKSLSWTEGWNHDDEKITWFREAVEEKLKIVIDMSKGASGVDNSSSATKQKSNELTKKVQNLEMQLKAAHDAEKALAGQSRGWESRFLQGGLRNEELDNLIDVLRKRLGSSWTKEDEAIAAGGPGGETAAAQQPASASSAAARGSRRTSSAAMDSSPQAASSGAVSLAAEKRLCANCGGAVSSAAAGGEEGGLQEHNDDGFQLRSRAPRGSRASSGSGSALARSPGEDASAGQEDHRSSREGGAVLPAASDVPPPVPCLSGNGGSSSSTAAPGHSSDVGGKDAGGPGATVAGGAADDGPGSSGACGTGAAGARGAGASPGAIGLPELSAELADTKAQLRTRQRDLAGAKTSLSDLQRQFQQLEAIMEENGLGPFMEHIKGLLEAEPAQPASTWEASAMVEAEDDFAIAGEQRIPKAIFARLYNDALRRIDKGKVLREVSGASRRPSTNSSQPSDDPFYSTAPATDFADRGRLQSSPFSATASSWATGFGDDDELGVASPQGIFSSSNGFGFRDDPCSLAVPSPSHFSKERRRRLLLSPVNVAGPDAASSCVDAAGASPSSSKSPGLASSLNAAAAEDRSGQKRVGRTRPPALAATNSPSAAAAASAAAASSFLSIKLPDEGLLGGSPSSLSPQRRKPAATRSPVSSSGAAPLPQATTMSPSASAPSILGSSLPPLVAAASASPCSRAQEPGQRGGQQLLMSSSYQQSSSSALLGRRSRASTGG